MDLKGFSPLKPFWLLDNILSLWSKKSNSHLNSTDNAPLKSPCGQQVTYTRSHDGAIPIASDL